jgi:hypothetical protein
MTESRWTEADYDSLTWHDNHVHGIAIREGPHGTGELILDIDFILEWVLSPDNTSYQFQIAPATLTFHGVSDLVISLDYVQPAAAITPFSISNISREPYVFPNGFSSYEWSVGVNWPEGFISFVAKGFTQELRSRPLLVSEQLLSTAQRDRTGNGV